MVRARRQGTVTSMPVPVLHGLSFSLVLPRGAFRPTRFRQNPSEALGVLSHESIWTRRSSAAKKEEPESVRFSERTAVEHANLAEWLAGSDGSYTAATYNLKSSTTEACTGQDIETPSKDHLSFDSTCDASQNPTTQHTIFDGEDAEPRTRCPRHKARRACLLALTHDP